ncbi:MAG: Nif3-like dinuclear metal center hexameric protein [Lentisphaerae bacterium]|nr:Nif3-like dinuclear metal center hexameric protein [Lentisphaerota bacterium]
MSMLSRIVGWLDGELDAASFADSSNNGLQVENSGKATRVCCGVDATMEFFEAAAARGGDLLVCHHGISWGASLARIHGIDRKRLSFLLERDIALYASHLPLDGHPRYGNNAAMARLLGLKSVKPFGVHGGRAIGLAGLLPAAMDRAAFTRLVARKMRPDPTVLGFGPERIRSVAVVSGGAAGDVADAGKLGLDAFVSGEISLSGYNFAKEYGVNAVFAGHYATERFGVCELGKAVSRKFRVPWEFIDLEIPW